MQEFTDEDREQYNALTQKIGIVDWSDRTTIAITGSDRIDFLNNLCTQNVKSLTAGNGCETFFCNVQGKILAHAFLFCESDRVVFDTVPGQADAMMAHIDKYIIMESVELENLTDKTSQLLVAGPDAEKTLGGLAKEALPSDALQHVSTEFDGLAGVGLTIIRNDILGKPSFAVQFDPSAKESVTSQLLIAGGTDCQAATAEAVRIENRFPLFGREISESSLPQEVGRDEQAISFTKGCYLGQETVARIDALGHVNWHLVRLDFESRSDDATGKDASDVTEGMEVVVDEKVVGKITSIGWSPATESPIALARVRREVETGVSVVVSGCSAVAR